MKFRLRRIAEIDYEPNPQYYPTEVSNDPEKMLAIDVEAFRNDPVLFLDGARIYVEGGEDH